MLRRLWFALALLVALPGSARALPFDRLGLSADALGEWGALDGTQSINATQLDESYSWFHPALSATVWMTGPLAPRWTWGPGVRLHGKLSTDRDSSFGMLGDAFVKAEFTLPAMERFEAVFGGRAGLSLLLPGDDFQKEIDRLQAEHVGVWSVPRLGWNAALSAGTRRQMGEHLALRLDVVAEVSSLLLFWDNEVVDGLQFQKNWTTSETRLFVSLGAEFSL